MNDLEDERPLKWDPEPERRQWYTHKRTSDEGWMVIRDGVDHIKYNRPNQDFVVPYKEAEWTKQEVHRTLTVMDMAMVAHIADQMLCARAQLYPEKRPDWANLRPEKKKFWSENGPSHPLRRKLYNAIREALKDDVS